MELAVGEGLEVEVSRGGTGKDTEDGTTRLQRKLSEIYDGVGEE